MSPGEQADDVRAWEALLAQRDKLSARLSWLAEHEEDRESLFPEAEEWEERREATTRSRARFEALLEDLAAWAGVGVGDLAQLLLDSEERDEERTASPHPPAGTRAEDRP